MWGGWVAEEIDIDHVDGELSLVGRRNCEWILCSMLRVQLVADEGKFRVILPSRRKPPCVHLSGRAEVPVTEVEDVYPLSGDMETDRCSIFIRWTSTSDQLQHCFGKLLDHGMLTSREMPQPKRRLYKNYDSVEVTMFSRKLVGEDTEISASLVLVIIVCIFNASELQNQQ
jgi:hypothetical protein